MLTAEQKAQIVTDFARSEGDTFTSWSDSHGKPAS